MKEKDMIFGIRAVIEALDSGKTLNKILLQKGLNNPLFRELTDKINPHRSIVQYVPIQKLNNITRKNHQGVIAFISPIEYHDLETIVPGIYETGEAPLILMLDRVTDVRNFGAIARTAECMGVHAIITLLKGGAMINGDAVKTSAGALNKIPVCREKYLDKSVEFLKNSGFQIVACTEKADNFSNNKSYTEPTCIIMGSEEDGISAQLLKMADEKVKLPMNGSIQSLNVSVAAGMLLYEVMTQRQA